MWFVQSPSVVFLQFTNVFYGLFSKWILEINPKIFATMLSQCAIYLSNLMLSSPLLITYH